MPHRPIGPTPRTNPSLEGFTTHGDPTHSATTTSSLCCSVECIDSLSGPESQRNWRENTKVQPYELTRLKSRYRIASLPLSDCTSSDSGSHCRLHTLEIPSKPSTVLPAQHCSLLE